MAKSTGNVQVARSVAWLVLRESGASFGANRGLESAATLAYYGFLSLMPLLLLCMFLLGTVLRSSEAVLSGVRSVTADLFPSFNDAMLSDLLTLSQQKVWGAVSIVILLWSMTPFAGAMRSAIFRIFKTDRTLHFLKAKLVDVTAILMLLSLFIGTVAWRVFVTARDAETAVNAAEHVFSLVLPFGVTLVVLGLFYLWFAPVRPRWTHVLAGAFTATVLLSAIRPLFGLLLHFNPDFGYAFGSLKAIFLLIVWAYYTFAVILFGAEVMANAQRREALLLRGFLHGDVPAKPGVARLIEQFVRTLEPGQALFEEGDEGHEMFYVQAGSVELRKGGQVLRVMKPGDYFGEMSMLLGAPRSAGAVAVQPDTRLVAISEGNFDTILRENPVIVRDILKEMAVRLKATSERVK
ncbi:MAG TPA: YhjD/YihY/BrkB family envelope integrity protein [Kiritimatiellia bacterium]